MKSAYSSLSAIFDSLNLIEVLTKSEVATYASVNISILRQYFDCVLNLTPQLSHEWIVRPPGFKIGRRAGDGVKSLLDVLG